MIPALLQEAFAFQARACASLGSPFMDQLCTLFATRDWPDTPLRGRYFAWDGDIGPSAQSLPLRLAGGLHALVLQGDPLATCYPPQQVSDDTLWAAITDAMIRQDAFLNNWVDSPPQTNEVRRSAVLIAVGGVLAERFNLPIRLSELGASAGLNLMWERFAMDIAGERFGDTDSTVVLAPDWDGPPPSKIQATVIARRGVDLNPLDPSDPADQLRLRAYLWPDQPDRMQRTEAAIALNNTQIDKADAIDWLAGQLDHDAGRLHLIYHTIAWQYFPDEVQERGMTLIEAAGSAATADAPLAWFGMEPDGGSPGAAMTLRIWPEDITIDLGRVDFHGRWVQWKGWQ